MPGPRRATRATATAVALVGLLSAAAGVPPSPAAVAASAARAPAAAASPEAGTWAWPLAPPHAVVRPFVAPATVYGAGHRGVDLAGTGGAEVRAPADGVVHFVGVVVDRPVLSLRHADGVLSSFEPVESTLARGDAVARGDVVGTLLPGHCRSPCLHLGARIDGAYVSPMLFLTGIPPSVLLPTRR